MRSDRAGFAAASGVVVRWLAGGCRRACRPHRRRHQDGHVVTTAVQIVPFDEVDAEHARLEGEGDQSLAHWRAVHEDFFTEHAAHDHGFASDMPIVCQRFEVLHSRQRPAG